MRKHWKEEGYSSERDRGGKRAREAEWIFSQAKQCPSVIERIISSH